MSAQQLQHIREMVGQLASLITEIDYGWYEIYNRMMHQTPLAFSDAVINLRTTGEAQRQLVMAVAGAYIPKDSELMRFLGKLIARTNELTARRNAAIHSVIFIALTTGKIHAIAVAKKSKLAEKDIQQELVACIVEANAVLDLITTFLDWLPDPARPPLKPTLPADGWSNPLSRGAGE
ncbi:MAG: hypothetical protein ABL962_06385 [Fimbriimonadaceae bacterium]